MEKRVPSRHIQRLEGPHIGIKFTSAQTEPVSSEPFGMSSLSHTHSPGVVLLFARAPTSVKWNSPTPHCVPGRWQGPPSCFHTDLGSVSLWDSSNCTALVHVRLSFSLPHKSCFFCKSFLQALISILSPFLSPVSPNLAHILHCMDGTSFPLLIFPLNQVLLGCSHCLMWHI